MRLRTRQFLRVLLAFGLSILWSHYVTVETARANNVLFVSDDTYSIVWILDSTTGETLRGFSVPEVAVGNSVPRGRSGLAYANNELYYTHSSSRPGRRSDASLLALQGRADSPRSRSHDARNRSHGGQDRVRNRPLSVHRGLTRSTATGSSSSGFAFLGLPSSVHLRFRTATTE